MSCCWRAERDLEGQIIRRQWEPCYRHFFRFTATFIASVASCLLLSTQAGKGHGPTSVSWESYNDDYLALRLLMPKYTQC